MPTPEAKEAFAEAAQPVYHCVNADAEGGPEIFDAMQSAVGEASAALEVERVSDIE